MTWFHWGQVGVASVAVVIATRRLRALLFDTNLDANVFLPALIERLAESNAEAREMCAAAAPAWVAQLAEAALLERSGRVPEGTVSEIAFDLRNQAVRGIRALRTIGRAASPLAFIGVMVELGLAFQGDHGLAALQRGLVEQIAMQNAIVGLTLGLVTSLCAFVAASTLHAAARQRMRDLKRVGDIFEQAG